MRLSDTWSRAPRSTLSAAKIEDNDPVMGMCNYCNELTQVYEQEDEYRSLFLVCKRCIKDIFVRIDIDEARDQ